MKVIELVESQGAGQHDLMDVLSNFLPFIVKEYNLPKLPQIQLVDRIADSEQPTFGKYVNNEQAIYLAILDRHPLDTLRTFAHELVHWKQDLEGRIDSHSGETGSPIENEAHELAGIAMRHFNKQHPEYFTQIKIPQSK